MYSYTYNSLGMFTINDGFSLNKEIVICQLKRQMSVRITTKLTLIYLETVLLYLVLCVSSVGAVVYETEGRKTTKKTGMKT